MGRGIGERWNYLWKKRSQLVIQYLKMYHLRVKWQAVSPPEWPTFKTFLIVFGKKTSQVQICSYLFCLLKQSKNLSEAECWEWEITGRKRKWADTEIGASYRAFCVRGGGAARQWGSGIWTPVTPLQLEIRAKIFVLSLLPLLWFFWTLQSNDFFPVSYSVYQSSLVTEEIWITSSPMWFQK